MSFALLSLSAVAQERIREAPISEFRTMPPQLRHELQARGCTVPQPPGSRRLENLIHGHFHDPQHADWAVLCDVVTKQTSEILVYWNGSSIHPAVLNKTPIVSNSGCWVTLDAIGKNVIMDYYKAFGGPKPPPIDHQRIDIGICEKASTVSYFYRNRWLTLAGSD